MRYFLVFVMISLFGSGAICETDINHYYIQIKGFSVDKFQVEIGNILYDDKFYPTKQPIDSLEDKKELVDILLRDLASNKSNDILNVFIHGVWADTKPAWQEMVQNISKDCYHTEGKEKKVVLSVIWNSPLFYKKAVKVARKKGDYLTDFFDALFEKNDGEYKINFLCHSMGNRVFQHIIQGSQYRESETSIINHYLAVAADVETNIFDEGEPLHLLQRNIKYITLFIHNNDRTLKMSKMINRKDRLGINGVPSVKEMDEAYRIVDVSLVRDTDDMASKIGNHRYFYTSESIRKDIQRILFEDNWSYNKKEMGHERRMALKPTL